MNDHITAHSGGHEKEKHTMKKLMLLASMLILTIVPQVNAQDGCSNADLRGVYSFVLSGTFGTSPFAAAGQTTYDGKGDVTGLIQISVGGTVTPVLPWSGTYTVDPENCTTTKTAVIPGAPLGPGGAPVTLTVHFFITAGDDFKELRFVATDPGTTISGTARRQHKQETALDVAPDGHGGGK
jgi:hypothetical protein